MRDTNTTPPKWIQRRNGKASIYRRIIKRCFLKQSRERNLTLLYARLRAAIPKYKSIKASKHPPNDTKFWDNEHFCSSSSVEVNNPNKRMDSLPSVKWVMRNQGFIQVLHIEVVSFRSQQSLPRAILEVLQRHHHLQLISSHSLSTENREYHSLQVQILKPLEVGDVAGKLCSVVAGAANAKPE